MIEDLLKQFTGSAQGSEALQTLQQQHGLSETDAQGALSAAASGAASALGSQGGGGDVGSLLAGLTQGGAAQGIMGALGGLAGGSGGGGLAGALQGGAGAMISDQIAEVVAAKTGINKQTALAIATTVLPFVLKFLQSRGAGDGQPTGEAPAGEAANPVQDAVGGLLGKLF